ncbi:hypothetical protein [Photobacterium nomapromontoriensis]|uniref:hypothetical protein n=1 Tax=Photobacterium nomapromontoriensis TaxID=2910237 RepID=UPI003D0E9142
MLSIPGVTNSGSMPINAGGGAAGPSNANADANNSFKVSGINMGGGSAVSQWLTVALGLAVVWFLIKKVG